jgi:hypothetical protein
MKPGEDGIASLCMDSFVYDDCHYACIGRKQQEKQKLMAQLKSLQGKITPSFMDYCDDKGVSLTEWYKWQLHIMWERRNIQRKTEKETAKQNVQSNLQSR